MVFSCEFPIYCARPGGQEGELVVAGGGGQSKTGVPNAIVSGPGTTFGGCGVTMHNA